MTSHHEWRIVLFALLFAGVAPPRVEATTYQMLVKSALEFAGKCVSASNGPFLEGMRVFIWDCNAGLALTLDYDDQTQQLKAGAQCVQVLGQGNVQDAVSIGTCNGGANQRWSMVATSQDVYQIAGINGLCLDISNGVMANGTPLDVAKCAPNHAAQLWALFQAPDASSPQATLPRPSIVQNIFTRHGLIGTFSEDCSKDPSDKNQYILHRLVNADHVERDQMKNRTVRSYAASVESAEELTANEIGMNILITETLNPQMKDWRMHLVTRIDDNRIRLMESAPLSGPYAGQRNIVAGKATDSGGETHWLTKCR